VVVSEETGLITFVENGEVKRNLDTTALRALLLGAMEISVVERKREATKTMKESESENYGCLIFNFECLFLIEL
jgi:hypothetical protein